MRSLMHGRWLHRTHSALLLMPLRVALCGRTALLMACLLLTLS